MPTIWWLSIDITGRKYSGQQQLKETKISIAGDFF
jgi:hypothetical protein